ncbi:unnamed protein product [Rotaria sp. Silwood2]|nr:unnamed protein product [Rotaria sp. Silwood2]
MLRLRNDPIYLSVTDESRQQLWLPVKISIVDLLRKKLALFIATVYLSSQCSNYTLDADATRLSTYAASTSACDVSVYSTPAKYCSKMA